MVALYELTMVGDQIRNVEESIRIVSSRRGIMCGKGTNITRNWKLKGMIRLRAVSHGDLWESKMGKRMTDIQRPESITLLW